MFSYIFMSMQIRSAVYSSLGQRAISKLSFVTKLYLKKVSEYDQEIPQSQTADKPMAPRGRATQPSQRHKEDKLSKATSSLFSIKMIAKLGWILSNVQQNIVQLDSHNGNNRNKKSTTTEPPP